MKRVWLGVVMAAMVGAWHLPGWSAPSAEKAPTQTFRPAPVWRFDGADYFLCDRQKQDGTKSLVFLEEGKNPETFSRRLWVRKLAGAKLRDYEKKLTGTWDQDQRDVRFRTDNKLVHSGWIQKGNLLVFRLMHWEMHGSALLCVELELVSRPPLRDAKSMRELVNRQYDSWRGQLEQNLPSIRQWIDSE